MLVSKITLDIKIADFINSCKLIKYPEKKSENKISSQTQEEKSRTNSKPQYYDLK